MKYDVFTRLESAIETYRLSVLGTKAAERDARETGMALADRKRNERERNDARRDELTRTIDDPSTNNTVRKLLKEELDDLEGTSYALSVEEAIRFDSLLNELRQAVTDCKTSYTAAKDAIREAKAAIEEIRTSVNGYADLDLLARSPDVVGADFERMLAAAQGRTQ